MNVSEGMRRFLGASPHNWAVCIRLGTRCNIACKYCLSDSGPSKPDVSNELIEAAFHIISAGPRRIIISGGEPFLVAEVVPLVLYAMQKRVPVKIGTNGLLPLRRFRWLSAVDRRGITVDVSLHGVSMNVSSPITGGVTVAKALECLSNIAALEYQVTANVPLLRYPVENYIQLINRVRSIGGNRVKLTRIFDLGRGRQYLTNMLMSQEEEDAISRELHNGFGAYVQLPLADFSTFSHGSLILEADARLYIAGMPFEDVSESQLQHTQDRNRELYR